MERKKGNQKKIGMSEYSDDEEQEIYGLDISSDEGQDDDDLMAESDDEDESDEDEQEDDNDDDIIKGDRKNEDGIPDSRAWGKKARLYHSTDYVDQDFGGFEGTDAELAQQEEEEAKEIQKRLTAELDESDFLDFLPSSATVEKDADKKTKPQKSKPTKEVLHLNLNDLSLADQKKLIERQCPEVVHFLEEYKEKLDMAINASSAVKNDDLIDELDPETKLLNDFYMTKYMCILNYCINISYFLYLRSTNPTNCKAHPVIKTILKYRRLLDELNQFKPKGSHPMSEGNLSDILPLKKLKTKIVSKKRDIDYDDDDDDLDDDEFEAQLLKKIKATTQPTTEIEESEANVVEDGTQEKRGITYEMAKNKGLTPKRKKEQRNPRVKHREKYRKATIRRKGQVRKPRTEVKKYDGEAYGINARVTKSIKLK